MRQKIKTPNFNLPQLRYIGFIIGLPWSNNSLPSKLGGDP